MQLVIERNAGLHIEHAFMKVSKKYLKIPVITTPIIGHSLELEFTEMPEETDANKDQENK